MHVYIDQHLIYLLLDLLRELGHYFMYGLRVTRHRYLTFEVPTKVTTTEPYFVNLSCDVHL